MRVSIDYSKVERLERQAPPPHTLPPKGEGVGGGVGLATDSRQAAAEWVRQNLPVCSAFAAEVQAEFGQVRMTYAIENGHVIGKPLESAAFSVAGDALLPMKMAR